MRLFYRDSTHRARLASATLIVAVTTWAGVPGARADEAQAKDIFKAMSDYLAAQTAFSFDYDTTLDVVTTDNQKLGIASSGSAASSGPTNCTRPEPADSRQSRPHSTARP